MTVFIGSRLRLTPQQTPLIPRAQRAVAAAVGCLVLGLWVPGLTEAQATGTAVVASHDSQVPQLEPVECWRRTSVSAVRVGEPFAVVLTCALLNTESTTVVADETKLDPRAAQFPPFEIIGGSHAADVSSAERRFFQYEYELRLINDSLFGQAVSLPAVPIGYRVQTRVPGGTFSEGLERIYLLPPQSIRVLSLLPEDATDIRDASAKTFGDLENASLRAQVLVASGGVLIGLAGVLGAVALLRTSARSRDKTSEAFSLDDRAILHGVDRELQALAREREAAGWTPELTGRALAALRIAGNYVLARPTNQREAEEDVEGADGALMLRAGWSGRRALVSASVTAQNIAATLTRASAKAPDSSDRVRRLVDLQSALTCFTRARYGRDDRDGNEAGDATIDESLASAQRMVAELLREHRWAVKKFRAIVARATRRKRRLWLR